MDESRKLYRVMWQAPATKVTYVVAVLQGAPCTEEGVLGWMVDGEGFIPAESTTRAPLYEDFDDADLTRSRFQQEQDAYEARKKRKSG